MIGLKIRKATKQDDSVLAKLHVDSWQGSYRGLLPDALLDDVTYDNRRIFWKKRLDNPHLVMALIAECKGAPVGFGSLWQEEKDPHKGVIYHLYVLKEKQRQGVGGKLFKKLMKAATDQKMESVSLETLGSGVSQHFYKAAGGNLVTAQKSNLMGHQVDVLVFHWELKKP